MSWRSTLARRGPWIGLGVVAVLGGALGVAIGPGAASLVDTLADGQEVWRLGRLRVDGVSGPHLGRLSARRILILDEQGAWLEANNARLRWNPWALLRGRVLIDLAAVESAQVLRRPTLGPPQASGGPDLSIVLQRAQVDALRLAPGVAGKTGALFQVSGSLRGATDAISQATLDMVRLDAASDRLRVRYNAAVLDSLQANLEGAPGGAFAGLLQLPDGIGVSLQAVARGDDRKGAAQARARVGNEPVLTLDATWGGGVWRAEATLAPTPIPVAADLTARLGGTIQLQGQGALPGAGQAGRFSASAAAPNLRAAVSGALTDGLQPQGLLNVAVQTEALGALAGQPDLGGAAALDGDVRRAGQRWTVDSRMRVSGLKVGEAVLGAQGPLSLVWAPTEAALEADLDVSASGQDVLARLLQQTRLRLDSRYDRTKEALYLRQMRVSGPNVELEASGALPEGGRISGRWALPRLQVVQSEIAGGAAGTFTLRRDAAGTRLMLIGNGKDLGGPDWANRLLGRSPKLELEAALQGDTVMLRRALLRGPQLRAGASGVVSGERLDLRLESSLKGPFVLGGASIEGSFDASGTVSGPIDAPALHVQAGLDQLDLAGLRVQQAALQVNLEGGASRTGGLTLDARLNGQPLRVRTGLALQDSALVLSNLEAQAARLQLRGDVALGARGPTGALTLDGALAGLWPGVAGRVDGSVALREEGASGPHLAASLNLRRFQLSQRLQLETVRLEADGPLSDLNWRSGLEGQAAGLPLQLQGQGQASFGDAGVTVRADLRGAYAERAIATAEPLMLRSKGDELSGSGALRLEDGLVRFALQQNGAMSLDAQLQRAPLALASVYAGEPLGGTVDGRITLTGRADRLDGTVDLQLSQARLAKRARDPFDARLSARLANDQVQATFTATSRQGLQANLDLRAPVVAAAAPFRLELGRAPAVAEWRVNGPIGGLWDIVGTLDRRLNGQVQGQGRAELAPGRLSGAGQLSLANAEFEDKLTGLRLIDLNAALRFDDNGAEVTTLTAKGPDGGSVSGDGRVAGLQQGRIDLQLANLKLVDRSDIEARAAGDVHLDWNAQGSRLHGALTLEQAVLRVDELRDVAAPTLDVVEINRPGDPPELAARRVAAAARGAPLPEGWDAEDEATGPAEADPLATALGGVTRLDLTIQAPRRIFTRGRGLDAEWALNLAVSGTLEEPRLTGQATLLRGSFALAGRTFDLQNGAIRFDGDPTNVLIELEAQNVGPDLTVTVRLTGSATDPQIQLISDPALPEDEILPQFLFGRSAGDLSPLEAAQLASSLATLARRSSFDLVASARNLVRLDRLDVRQEQGGVSIAGGRYVTRNVYLELSRGALGEAGTKVEWQVRPRLYIVSSFLTNGDQRLSVRWRHDLGAVRAQR